MIERTKEDAELKLAWALYSSAPELLEALKHLLSYVDKSNLDGGAYTRNARNVIARAEGR